MTTLFIVSVSITTSLILDSFIEWATHRFPMHHRLPGMKFFFWHHVTVHHTHFSGNNYYQHDSKVRGEILFPFWVPPLLIGTATAPYALASFLFENWIPFYCSLGVALCYYMAFEGFHQLMHLPDSPVVRFIRESSWFKLLDRHHRIHHMKASTNFNLVLPIADWAIGTLYTKAPNKEQM